jgi:hypothetical protein
MDEMGNTRSRWVPLLGAALTIAGIALGSRVIRELHWGWWGTIVLFALAFAATVGLALLAERRTKRIGADSPANRRYNRRILVFALLYGASLIGSAWAWRAAHVGGPWLWPIAAAPALAVLGMIWAMGRLIIEETDEYLRWKIVAHSLVATGGLLAVTTFWGFLEMFKLVPHVPAWGSLPLFAVLMGLSQALRLVRT